MLYRVRIVGTSPIITNNGAAGLDTQSAWQREKREITSRRGSNRTEVDEQRLRWLDCATALYLDADGAPTLPSAALRSNLEGAAKKLKQGGDVREGLTVLPDVQFEYDVDRYGVGVDALANTAQFTVGVVQQRNRILRTRAMFELPWAVEFEIDADDDLVDAAKLEHWLDIGGRRVGLGDWRPQKSGSYGRYTADWVSSND